MTADTLDAFQLTIGSWGKAVVDAGFTVERIDRLPCGCVAYTTERPAGGRIGVVVGEHPAEAAPESCPLRVPTTAQVVVPLEPCS